MALLGRVVAGAALGITLVVGGCAAPTNSRYEAVSAPQATALATPRYGQKALQQAPVDRIVVEKSQRRMMLLRDGVVVATYDIALGRNPIGDKVREGDGRTPEGVYHIDMRNPGSAFYRSLRISYPSQADRARAAALQASPGGAIMIHGLPNGKGWLGRAHLETDWTDGCIAVTNREMDEIWRAVSIGTIIEIRA